MARLSVDPHDAEVTYHDCKVTVVSSEPVFIHFASGSIPAMPLASVNYPEFKAFACLLQQGQPKASKNKEHLFLKWLYLDL